MQFEVNRCIVWLLATLRINSQLHYIYALVFNIFGVLRIKLVNHQISVFISPYTINCEARPVPSDGNTEECLPS